MDQQKITRITFPTASFSLENRHIRWLEQRSKKLAVAKSVLVREAIDEAIDKAAREEAENAKQEGVAA